MRSAKDIASSLSRATDCDRRDIAKIAIFFAAIVVYQHRKCSLRAERGHIDVPYPSEIIYGLMAANLKRAERFSRGGTSEVMCDQNDIRIDFKRHKKLA